MVWTTTFEQNSQFIFIEKSDDNKAFFQKDEQAAVGVSTGIVSYRFIDKNPIFGHNYYRLRYTDLANKSYVGPTVSFNFLPLSILNLPIDQFRVYPNPATDFVLIDTFLENPTIQLVDAKGISVPFELIKIGDSSYKIILANNPSIGIYHVVVSNSVAKQTKKIIVN